jgi:hypothetical protein
MEVNLIEIDKTFKDVNPILARENTFYHYHSYLDVLLKGKGKKCVSHNKAVTNLQDFLKSGQKHKIPP